MRSSNMPSNRNLSDAHIAGDFGVGVTDERTAVVAANLWINSGLLPRYGGGLRALMPVGIFGGSV